MTEKKTTIQGALIKATIDCIEKQGLAITTRTIAKAAGVNSAAINYYFGSKERLIKKALTQALDGYFRDIENLAARKNKNLRTALQAVLNYSLVGMTMYPGVTKAHLYSPFMHGDYRGRYIKRLNIFLANLVETYEPSASKERKQELKYRIMQIVSAIMMVGLFPSLFVDLVGYDMKGHKQQKIYIARLLQHFFPEK